MKSANKNGKEEECVQMICRKKLNQLGNVIDLVSKAGTVMEMWLAEKYG
jgi:hypothetical protein